MSFVPRYKSKEDARPTTCLAHMGLNWASAIVCVLVAAASFTEANPDQQQSKQSKSRKLQQVICSSNCHVHRCLVCDGFCCLPLLSSEMDKWLASCKQDASLHQAPHHDKDEAYLNDRLCGKHNGYHKCCRSLMPPMWQATI